MRIHSKKALLGLALALAGFIPGTLSADPVKGGERMLLVSQQSAQTTAPAAMNCAMCKTVPAQTTTTDKGRTSTKLTEKHLCPSCTNTVSVAGMGKTAKTEVKHLCDMCED